MVSALQEGFCTSDWIIMSMSVIGYHRRDWSETRMLTEDGHAHISFRLYIHLLEPEQQLLQSHLGPTNVQRILE